MGHGDLGQNANLTWSPLETVPNHAIWAFLHDIMPRYWAWRFGTKAVDIIYHPSPYYCDASMVLASVPKFNTDMKQY